MAEKYKLTRAEMNALLRDLRNILKYGDEREFMQVLRKIGIRGRITGRPPAAGEPCLDPRMRVSLADDVIPERAQLSNAIAHDDPRRYPGGACNERHTGREVLAMAALADSGSDAQI